MKRRDLIIAALVTRHNRLSFAALMGFLAPYLEAGRQSQCPAARVVPCSTSEEVIDVIQSTHPDTAVVGAQSGNQARLDGLNRRHTLDDVERAVRIIHGEGLTADVDFILGFPDESGEERKETVRFMQGLVKGGARVHAHSFLPLAGTPLYDDSPSAIDPETRTALERLSGAGAATGQWRKQEVQGQQLRRFLTGLRSRREGGVPKDSTP